MSAKKSAPRDKSVDFAPERYLVTQQPHFINGSVQPVGAIVCLPVGVKPGKKLVEVDTAGKPVKGGTSAEEPSDAEVDAKDKPAKGDKPAK